MNSEHEAIEILKYEAAQMRQASQMYERHAAEASAKAQALIMKAEACDGVAESMEHRAAELEAGATVETTPGHTAEA
ncbi:MAG: hypothetical protein KAQ88_11055 [Hyphomicrobiaceae bacterium]|nr:hypothetical protein [Hyphomicrobiaceae bacterium]